MVSISILNDTITRKTNSSDLQVTFTAWISSFHSNIHFTVWNLLCVISEHIYKEKKC